jgi:hypothetical protein
MNNLFTDKISELDPLEFLAFVQPLALVFMGFIAMYVNGFKISQVGVIALGAVMSFLTFTYLTKKI